MVHNRWRTYPRGPCGAGGLLDLPRCLMPASREACAASAGRASSSWLFNSQPLTKLLGLGPPSRAPTNGRPVFFSCWFSGCWRALAEGTAWAVLCRVTIFLLLASAGGGSWFLFSTPHHIFFTPPLPKKAAMGLQHPRHSNSRI